MMVVTPPWVGGFSHTIGRDFGGARHNLLPSATPKSSSTERIELASPGDLLTQSIHGMAALGHTAALSAAFRWAPLFHTIPPKSCAEGKVDSEARRGKQGRELVCRHNIIIIPTRLSVCGRTPLVGWLISFNSSTSGSVTRTHGSSYGMRCAFGGWSSFQYLLIHSLFSIPLLLHLLFSAHFVTPRSTH